MCVYGCGLPVSMPCVRCVEGVQELAWTMCTDAVLISVAEVYTLPSQTPRTMAAVYFKLIKIQDEEEEGRKRRKRRRGGRGGRGEDEDEEEEEKLSFSLSPAAEKEEVTAPGWKHVFGDSDVGLLYLTGCGSGAVSLYPYSICM